MEAGVWGEGEEILGFGGKGKKSHVVGIDVELQRNDWWVTYEVGVVTTGDQLLEDDGPRGRELPTKGVRHDAG